MKIIEKDKAIRLRKQGKTFSEILECIPVSKSSLSYWLRNISLTDKQISRVYYKNELIKRKFIDYNLLKKKQAQERKELIINSAAKEVGSMSQEQLKLIGISLYWAEGYRAGACSTVDFTNSDPAMIGLIMRWLREVCQVPEQRLRVRLQIHDLSKKTSAINYWSKITGVSESQFTKPYVKTSPSSKNKAGNSLVYGICSIRISDTSLFNKIQGWIKGLMALSSSPA